jgi:hypothetical protein
MATELVIDSVRGLASVLAHVLSAYLRVLTPAELITYQLLTKMGSSPLDVLAELEQRRGRPIGPIVLQLPEHSKLEVIEP